MQDHRRGGCRSILMEQLVDGKHVERFRRILKTVTDNRFRDRLEQLIADLEARESSKTVLPHN